jgi:hypothetical protein
MLIAAIGTVLYLRRTPTLPPEPEPEPIVQPEPTPPPVAKPDLAAIRARVETLLPGLDCAYVASRLADDDTLHLDGFVSKPEDLTRLRSNITKIEGSEVIRTDLGVQPWPFCEILRVLTPLTPAGLSAEGGPRLNLNNADQRYRTGEKLVVTATMGSAFEGYLYVDYIDSDGSVVHLLPSPRKKANHILPGQEIVLGALDATDASGDFVYEIQPPLGPGMVVAFASRHRLWEAPRPHVETTSEYVPVLQDALQAWPSGKPQGGLVSTHAAIEIY